MSTFYRLLGFLRAYKRGLIVSWLLPSAAIVFTVGIPILTGQAVDAIKRGARHGQHHELAARSHDRHTLMLLAVAIVGAVLVRWVFTTWR